MQQADQKRVLFYRDYKCFQGGHLKVWDYFQHVAASATYRPRIHFSSDSLWDGSNPWSGLREDWREDQWNPEQADVLFLAGLDWQKVPLTIKTPIINLIQHVCHGEAGNPRREFLRRPALRICVSEEVRQAIMATGLVKGPVVTIPNGIELPKLTADAQIKDKRILIAGMKNPTMAKQLALHLHKIGEDTSLQIEPLPRSLFLEQLKNSELVITLPHEQEGFFLPALEAMAMGCIVICPDCIGNQSFCLDGVNAFRPNYCLDAILQATLQALALPESRKQALLKESLRTVENHSLNKERSTFHSLLTNMADEWKAIVDD
jgi:hypothetical protein